MKGNSEKITFIGRVAFIANKLPHPVTIFIVLSIVIAFLSALLSNAGVGVTVETINNATKQIEEKTYLVKNILNAEGIRWIFGSAIKNFINFGPLGVVLFFTLFFNFLEEVGLFNSFLKKLMKNVNKKYVSYFIAFLAVNSSFASDIGYILVIPVAAIIYKQLGRNPLAGITLAFAGTSAGFAACLISIDAVLSGLTTAAANIVDPNYNVSPIALSVFMFFYTFIVTFVVAFVNDKYIEPKLTNYAIEVDEKETENIFEDLTSIELKGLKWAGIGFICSIAIICLLSIPSSAPLRDPNTGVLILGKSPFLTSIIPIICFVFFIPGIFYGVAVGKIKNDKNLMTLLFKALDKSGSFIVLCFFSSIFISWFTYSQLGTIIAVKGGEFLTKIGLEGLPLVIAFILLVAFINLFIGSMTSKYVLLAPIFVPMLYKMGISPELTQLAYRLGDSSTNIISPLMPYFSLILVYCNQYNKKFGFGDLITYMLPHSICILISCIIFLVVYLVLNLPLGFGTIAFL